MQWLQGQSSPTVERETRHRAGCRHHPGRRRSQSCPSGRPSSRWTSSTCPECAQTRGSSSAPGRPWWPTRRRPPSASGWWTTCRGRWRAGWPWHRALSWSPARWGGACTRWAAGRQDLVLSWGNNLVKEESLKMIKNSHNHGRIFHDPATWPKLLYRTGCIEGPRSPAKCPYKLYPYRLYPYKSGL